MSAPDVGKPATSATRKRKYCDKSTATVAQRHRIIEALRAGPKTSYDLRRIGCYQAPARIKELRDRYGYSITTELVTMYDHDGYLHRRVARYHLHEKFGASEVSHEQ